MRSLPRRVAIVLCCAAASLSSAWAPPAAAADRGVLLRSGDRLTAGITDGDVDAFDVDLPEGGTAEFSVAALTTSALRPAIRLVQPDGAEFDVTPFLVDAGTRTPRLKPLAVPAGQTGRWQLLVAGTDATTGGYRVTARVVAPPPVHLRGVTLAAGTSLSIPVAGDSTSTVTAKIRVLSGAPPARVRVTDPAGQDLVLSDKAFRPRGARPLKGKVALSQGLGAYGVVVEGAAGADCVIDVDVSVRSKNRQPRKATLPPETEASAAAPAVVRQEGTEIAVDLAGSNFLPGTSARVEGGGVNVTDSRITSEGALRLVLDVAADAAYGLRRVVVEPPHLLGESVPVADAVTVLAPLPTLAAAAPGMLEQDSAGTLTVTGTGIRAGATLVTTGTGVALSPPAWVSITEFTVDYAVAPDATLSLRDLAYTQPGAGGGDSTTLVAAYRVMPHGPELTSLTPAALAPGASHATVRVAGGYFNATTAAAFSGAGVIVHSAAFVNVGTLTLDVSVAADAAIGRRDVTITPGAGGGPPRTFPAALTVAAPDPIPVSFSHAMLCQGAASLSVAVTGRNFRPGDTISASGQGVTFSTVTVNGTTQIAATASVAVGAATGLRTLTVTHAAADGGRSASLPSAFRVIGAVPTVVSVNPPAAGVTGGATREVPVEVTGTNFMTGASLSFSKTGGTGVSVVAGSVQVVSDTLLTGTVSLAGAATTGLWDARVTNPASLGDSGATGAGKFDVKSSSTLAVNRVLADSGSAYGGERVTIQGSGFAAGASVDFGTARASATQVLDANTIVTTVPVPAAVSNTGPTAVDVVVTNSGGGAATLRRGYRYAADGVRFVTLSTVPAQGATGVALNLKSAVVVLSAPIDPTTGGYGNITGVDTFWFESGGAFVAGGLRGIGPGGRFLVFSRSSAGNLPIATAGLYVLDVPAGMRSRGGNAFVPTRLASTQNHDQQTFTLSSTATDTTAPSLSSIAPANASTGQDPMTRVVLTFSEALDPLTVGASTITFRQGTTTVPASMALSDDLRTVMIVPEAELAASTTYTVAVTASVADLCGNAAGAATQTFTTAAAPDTIRPAIDAVVVESLPASLDGSGAYVNAQGAAGQNFDLYLPRSGWSIEVRFSDGGGSGIDDATFSAKCSAAVGSSAANAELASFFTVTSTGASWRIPSSAQVAAGGNTSFTFLVRDKAGNTATARTITMDVADKDGTAARGGDLDPLDSRRTWILRTDLDAFTTSYASTTTPAPQQGATTTVAANGVPDLVEALRLAGLDTANMTSAAAAAVNGLDTGTNAIVRRIFVERVRELLNERFGIDADGTHRGGSVDVEFLLPGEQGSLASAPVHSAANSANSSKPFSEISLSGTIGAESNAYATSSKLGDGWYDDRNRREEANLDTGGANDTGVYLLGAFKAQVNANALFKAKISSKLIAVHGGQPVGEHGSDDDVLAGSFVRGTSTDATHNARYDAIMDAIEHAALYASAVLAHEIGHSLGLVADGAPKTGLFGAAHYNNAFTEATSAAPNTSKHLDWLGNDLMAAASTFDSTTLTGSDFKRFSPLDVAYLLNRLLYDEGK